jgi:protein-S-isoprenylcysteine O-methyltransferase Ste14
METLFAFVGFTSERQFAFTLTWVLIALSAIAVVVLLLTPAPYGRFVRSGWGPQISSRVGWLVMASPAVVVFAVAFLTGDKAWAAAPLTLFALWQLHYVYRAFVYPFRMRGAKTMTALVAFYVGLFVTAPYGYLNGRQLSQFGDYPTSWLWEPRFLVGAALFVVGFAINHRSDLRLMKLRAPGETGYRIPTGGLFRWISCPNYFGELIEWFGWAVATWSLPGLAFALWGAANMVPRAMAQHRWYHEHFPDYPPERRAVLPRLL